MTLSAGLYPTMRTVSNHEEPHNVTLLVKGSTQGRCLFLVLCKVPTEEKALYLWVTWSDNNDQFDVGQSKVKVRDVSLRHFSFMLQA